MSSVDRMLQYLVILTNILQCSRTFPSKSNSYTFETSSTWILYPAHDLKFCFEISSHCIIYLAGISMNQHESPFANICFYCVCKTTNCLAPKYNSWDSAKLLFRISLWLLLVGERAVPTPHCKCYGKCNKIFNYVGETFFKCDVQISSKLKTSRGWHWSYQQLKSQCSHLSSMSVLKVYLR